MNREETAYKDHILKKNSTDAIRAVAAIVIVFCHLVRTMQMRPENPLLLLNVFASDAVGIFFFYTGYNLLYGYIHKEGTSWTKEYWRKKITRIYLPFVLMNLVFQIYWWLLGKEPYDIKIIIECLLGFYVLGTTLWYIQSVMLVYALFYVVFRLAQLMTRGGKTRCISAVCSIVVVVMYSALYAHFGAYIAPDSIFPLSLLAGMLFAISEDKLAKFIRRYKWELFFSLAFVSFVLHRYGVYGYRLVIAEKIELYEILRPLATALAANALIVDEEIKSPVLSKISSISLPLYLTHTICYQILRSELIYIKGDLAYMVMYLVCLTITALGMKKLIELNETLYTRIANKLPERASNFILNM